MTIYPTQKKHIKYFETLISLLIWLGVFAVPFFKFRPHDIIEWEHISKEWLRLSAFLFIYYLNLKILVPRLLYKKKFVAYIGIILISMFLIIGLNISIRKYILPTEPIAMPSMNYGPNMPLTGIDTHMPTPTAYKPAPPPENKSIFIVFFDYFVISILVVAAGTALKLISLWLFEEGRRMDVEKEQLKTELALLRQQVSPHFLMNTLNNIHALVDINTDTAKDAIIQLSTLMRYLLYDSSQGRTSLRKEIEFIESYIQLMRLRYSDKVSITVEIPKRLPDIQVPPMLFISFIENAFKHGVSYKNTSFVSFKIEILQNTLFCHIRNSQNLSKNASDPTYSGIGMANVKKSLDILFDKNYNLIVDDNELEFDLKLTIPLYDNKMPIH